MWTEEEKRREGEGMRKKPSLGEEKGGRGNEEEAFIGKRPPSSYINQHLTGGPKRGFMMITCASGTPSLKPSLGLDDPYSSKT